MFISSAAPFHPGTKTDRLPEVRAALFSVAWSLLVTFAFFLSGCSPFVEQAGPVVLCHDTKEPRQCPTDPTAGRRAARTFSVFVGPLSEEQPLEIHWYDWDHEFEDEPGDVVGYARPDLWPQQIHVRNTGVMMHELTHIYLDREAGNADQNHELPPGPWGEAHNAAVERAAKAFGVTNGVYVEGVTDVE